MKNYKLVADNFKLEIELRIFGEDIDIPINSILNIKINSNNFVALTSMDIDIKMFQKFASELLNVYNSLSGVAVLKETYGNNFIMFKAISNGHIYVNGIANNFCRNGYEQELKFENEFDQTYLKDFVIEINKPYNR